MRHIEKDHETETLNYYTYFKISKTPALLSLEVSEPFHF